MIPDPRIAELADLLVENDRKRRELDASDYRIRMEIAARISGGYVTEPEVKK